MKKRERKNFWDSRIASAIKIISFIILGFLPSFIFISLFIQYGTPSSNFITFLIDINSSWGAWILAIVISLLLHFIDKLVRSRKKIKFKLTNKTVILIILTSILVIGLVAAQAYLYVNYLLRNDTLVRLSAEENNLFFTENQNQDVNFKISVTTNPFCSAECNYNFVDLSTGKEIDSGSFNLTTIFSKIKKYTLENNHLVSGSQTLNRFEVSCKSIKTFLCYTGGEESKRAVLLTLNYNLTQTDFEFKKFSKKEILLIGENLSTILGKLTNSSAGLFSINNSFDSEILQNSYSNLSYSFIKTNDSFYLIKKLWETQNFSYLKRELPQLNNQIQILSADAEKLNQQIISNVSFYNGLVENLTNSREILKSVSLMNIDSSSCIKLNDLVLELNYVADKLNSNIDLIYEGMIVENISLEIKNFYNSIQTNPSNPACSLIKEITNKTLSKIEIIPSNVSNYEIFLNEPVSSCCFLGKCETCCENQCSKENYPVIFLHGHLINKALPSDYSLDTFNAFKEKLTSENYIDAGSVVLSSIKEPKGLWGKVDARVIVTASYFFDTNQTANGEITVQSNDKSIETYAERLNKIVELVKYRTNKDKVIIVAHSMGGVVTRKYVQTFGGKNVDEIIIVTAPNHGIDSKIRDYCALLGAEIACREMDKDSEFMKKLNLQSTELVPTYNIVGVGCNMGDETGDGIIKNSSQYLNSATNYQVKGICNELNFQYLHEYIVYPDKYPETYNIISNILKNK